MSTKAKKKPEAKAESKAAKTSKKAEVIEVKAQELTAGVEGEVVDEDEAEEAAARSQSGDSNAAALAAATSGSTEASASFKNFRHHPDMENFYRFIFENDLRYEALAILDEMTVQKATFKQVKAAKKIAH